ncbi:hypothetical protein BDY17DRAFT_309058 [Neohortaea acidophila]|uniref:Uncharacterized protein n=1 Tax=Neohortaea acidophila TaxID=245834 RepID=A0A6A6Q154_9PEZI|nr:uncharacterized protein BDY17DRAFT_309058 [Neohortaea acidophila]KAF2485751.1 hypothetical protein BDY17DRAFT_309058 [Neohortaea acidophila]
MDPTTLITFLFKAPPEVRLVELLGSWDNFTQPYLMHRDRKRGPCCWSGCFKYQNVIFDGDKPNWSRPRTGGLKQGGTYWYYYRLDNDFETPDETKDLSTHCPLLPGQTVNVIDIPLELADSPVRSRSASLDAFLALASESSTHTLEPGDKFSPLEPPPVSRVHQRCVSELALSTTLVDNEEAAQASPTSPGAFVTSTQAPSVQAPKPRYYTDVALEDDEYSVYSRESWSSAASSLAHSSVLDAYECHFENNFGAPTSYSPVLDTPPMPSRSAPPCPADLVSAVSMFETPPMPTRPAPSLPYITSESAASMFEGHGDMEETTQRSTTLRPTTFSSSSDGDDRPCSRHGSSSAVTNFRAALAQHSNFQSTSVENFPTFDSNIHASVPEDDYIREEATEEDQAAPNESAIEEDPYEEMLSPTFSAPTLSSRGGGVNTPYRLSAGPLRIFTSGEEDTSLESVAERLRSLNLNFTFTTPALDSSPSPSLPSPSALRRHEDEQRPRLFAAYSLPEQEVPVGLGMSEHHGAKARGGLLMPPAVEGEQDADEEKKRLHRFSSFADSIFSELGYLGSSIG